MEWQIYFLFPLLLLPVYRRLGNTGVILSAFAVPLVGHFIGRAFFDQAHLWFLGLFGMGMVAASINFSPQFRESKMKHLPWGVFSLIAALAVISVSLIQGDRWRKVSVLHWFQLETWGGNWSLEIVAGIATAAFILHCTERVLQGSAEALPLFRLFNSRTAIWLGVFSYSLYLINDPVLEIALAAVQHLPVALAVLLMLVVGLLLTVSFAYLFHLAFEKRFMPAHFRAVEKRLTASEEIPTGEDTVRA